MKKIAFILLLMTGWIFYSSCNKNKDPQNPDPGTIDSVAIMGFKDSTLLIKSIHNIDYDGDGSFYDSATTYISYDTLNKKIIITYGDGNDKQEFIYNSKGLLSQLRETGDVDYRTDYAYDESNILKSVTGIGEYEEDNYVISINKTLLSSGNYRLEWEAPSDVNAPGMHETFLADFDSEGRTLSYYDYTNNELFIADSVLYDAQGNISKVIRTLKKPVQDNPDAMVTFTQYAFKSRDTKGDQLYNLYRILYNGISNFSDIYSGIYGPFNEKYFQVFKYPAIATDISMPSGDSYSIARFNNVPEFDGKNRLIQYDEFFSDGGTLYKSENFITYYK